MLKKYGLFDLFTITTPTAAETSNWKFVDKNKQLELNLHM